MKLREMMLQLSCGFILMAGSLSISAQNKVVVIPLEGDTAYQVKSGQLLTGAVSVSGRGNSFYSFAISYASPLPVGTPLPIVIYNMTNGCTAPGVAPSGVICFYSFTAENFDSLGVTATNNVSSAPYGLAFFTVPSITANLHQYSATWAYRVP